MSVEMAGGRFECRFPLIGRHNVYNALAADRSAGSLSTSKCPILQGALNTARPCAGPVGNAFLTRLGFGVYVDYAHTDDALRNVLSTLREITRGRLLLAFGCGGNRDKGKRPRMGQVAAELADFTLITSDNPRKESAAQIAAEIAEGYRQVRSDNYRIELDRRRAIEEITAPWPGRVTVC